MHFLENNLEPDLQIQPFRADTDGNCEENGDLLFPDGGELMASDQRRTILAYLTEVPDACAADLADAIGMSLPAAGMQLLRLTRNGLVSRVFDRRYGVHSYGLTPKGRARLEFFRLGGQ